MINNPLAPFWRRPYADILLERADQPRRFMQVRSGPRQVGKTTMALQVLERRGKPHHYVVLPKAVDDAIGRIRRAVKWNSRHEPRR